MNRKEFVEALAEALLATLQAIEVPEEEDGDSPIALEGACPSNVTPTNNTQNHE